VKLRLQIAHLSPRLGGTKDGYNRLDFGWLVASELWDLWIYGLGSQKRHTSAVIKVLYYSHYQIPLLANIHLYGL